jgi:hypothetical protein
MSDPDDNTPDALDYLIIGALSDLTPHERKRLFEDGVTPEQDREASRKEFLRIFGPGWFDDVRKTIEEMDERDQQAAVERVN